jgi:hypothetical protein
LYTGKLLFGSIKNATSELDFKKKRNQRGLNIERESGIKNNCTEKKKLEPDWELAGS